MPDTTKRRKAIDDAVEKAVNGEKKPSPKKDEVKEAEARIARGRSRALDSRIYGSLEKGKEAARDLVKGTMALNKARARQSTDDQN